MQSNDLNGVCVLVTRPAKQAQHLKYLIEQNAGIVVLMPLIDIVPCQDEESSKLFSTITDYDLVIFVSANAVINSEPFLNQQRTQLPPIGVIGSGTAKELEAMGIKPTLVPQESFDSEGFLQLAELQSMSGKKVLIVRGKGGREKLCDELRARGAQVDYAEIYQRQMPDIQVQPTAEQIDVITLTSSNIMDNLVAWANQQKQNWVFEKPLIVIHDRIARHAQQCNFKGEVHVTVQGSDEAIVDKLIEWKSNQGARSS